MVQVDGPALISFQLPACCNTYHMAKQLVVCFQDSLLVGIFSYSWFIYVREGLQLLLGKWVMERLLSESYSLNSCWKFLYPVSSSALAVRRSIATSEGVTVPVERLVSSVGSSLNGLIHSVSITSTSACTASSLFRIRDDSKSWWLTPGGLISVSSRSCFRQVLLYSAVK